MTLQTLMDELNWVLEELRIEIFLVGNNMLVDGSMKT